MNAVIVPTSSYPRYRQRVRLDGRNYLLALNWNSRAGYWLLDLYTDEEEPLVLGLTLQTNWPLLRYYHHDPRVPAGELVAVSTNDDDSPAGLGELGEGKRVELTYYPVAS